MKEYVKAERANWSDSPQWSERLARRSARSTVSGARVAGILQFVREPCDLLNARICQVSSFAFLGTFPSLEINVEAGASLKALLKLLF